MDKDKDGALTSRAGRDIDAFVEAAQKPPAPSGLRSRAADLRPRRDHEPAADLGPRAGAAGEDVPDGGELGGLDVQLVYYRGLDECRASKFVSGGQGLAELMSRHRRARRHRRRSARSSPTRATRRSGAGSARSSSSATRWRRIPTGSPASQASSRCRRQGLHVPGRARPAARRAFEEIARLTGGAYSAFDAGASAGCEALLRGGRGLCRRESTRRLPQAADEPGGAAPPVADASSDRGNMRPCRWRAASSGELPTIEPGAISRSVKAYWTELCHRLDLALSFADSDQTVCTPGRRLSAARYVRQAAALGLIGALLLLLRGRVSLAAALAGMAASFAGWRARPPAWSALRAAGRERPPGARSTARSAMIEMRLDHDSGVIDRRCAGGRLCAGGRWRRCRGRMLVSARRACARRSERRQPARGISRPPVRRLA